MRCDEPVYFTKNGTELPARPTNVLLVEGPGTGELELMLSESKEVEEDFSLLTSSPSTRERSLEVVYSNRSPRWRLVQPCLWESGMGRWDDRRLR